MLLSAGSGKLGVCLGKGLSGLWDVPCHSPLALTNSFTLVRSFLLHPFSVSSQNTGSGTFLGIYFLHCILSPGDINE